MDCCATYELTQNILYFIYQKERENPTTLRREESEEGIPVTRMTEVYEEKRMKTRQRKNGGEQKAREKIKY